MFSVAYMRQCMGSTLVQVMDWRLFDVRLLPLPIDLLSILTLVRNVIEIQIKTQNCFGKMAVILPRPQSWKNTQCVSSVEHISKA